MKNIIAASLVALAALALPSCVLDDIFGSCVDAHGSDDDVRTVSSATELLEWMYEALSAPAISCTLAADIDMTGQTWMIIADYEGTFDGGGHTISGLNINPSSTSTYTGFVGSIGKSGTIKDLHIEGNVTGSGKYTGGIAGYSEGCIAGCSFYGTVTASDYGFAGGIAGASSGKIVACYSAGTVQEKNRYAGGIAGCNSYGTIFACYSTADVSASMSYKGGSLGGIAGSNDGGEMKYNFYSGDVSGGSSSDTSDGYAQAKVDGTSLDWPSAMSAMNNALWQNGYSYSYKANSGSDSAAFPLVLN